MILCSQLWPSDGTEKKVRGEIAQSQTYNNVTQPTNTVHMFCWFFTWAQPLLNTYSWLNSRAETVVRVFFSFKQQLTCVPLFVCGRILAMCGCDCEWINTGLCFSVHLQAFQWERQQKDASEDTYIKRWRGYLLCFFIFKLYTKFTKSTNSYFSGSAHHTSSLWHGSVTHIISCVLSGQPNLPMK